MEESVPLMWGYYPGWSGMLLMILSNILWIALLGLLVRVVIRWFVRRASTPGLVPASPPSALEILHQGCARGEIATATFEQMRERLDASDRFDAKEDIQKQPMMKSR